MTSREQRLIAFGAAAVWGWLRGRNDLLRNTALAVGIGGVVREAYGLAQEKQLFSHPELMNGYFQTGGELSAVRSPADAAALKKGTP